MSHWILVYDGWACKDGGIGVKCYICMKEITDKVWRYNPFVTPNQYAHVDCVEEQKMEENIFSVKLPDPNFKLKVGNVEMNFNEPRTIKNRIKWYLASKFFPLKITRWVEEDKEE